MNALGTGAGAPDGGMGRDPRDQARLRQLADEQAALRRVATLVAEEASATDVFAKVAEELGLLLGAEGAWMHRYEPDGNVTIVASWGELETALPVGARLDLEGDNVAARVRRTERPARVDDYATAEGAIAAAMHELGLRSAVGSPIVTSLRTLWRRSTPPWPASASVLSGVTSMSRRTLLNMPA